MKRKLAEDWTRFLDGGAVAPTTEALSLDVRETLRRDLTTDSLLRARARGLSDGDAFTIRVIDKVNQLVAADGFTQRVSQRLQRQRALRRVGVVAGFLALSAAAAWYVHGDRAASSIRPGRENIAGPPDAWPPPSYILSPLSEALRPTMAGQSAPAAKPLHVLLVVGDQPPSVSDGLLRDRFERLGIRTVIRLPSQLSSEEGSMVDLLAISSTVESADFADALARWIAALPIPVVVWEPWLFDDLGLAACEDNHGCGRAVTSGELTLVARGMPLLTWPHDVVTVARAPIVASFGIPRAGAITVATAETDQTRAVLFVYERGSALAGGPAPARRVALFLADDTARFLTDEGWELFDGAIAWALGHP